MSKEEYEKWHPRNSFNRNEALVHQPSLDPLAEGRSKVIAKVKAVRAVVGGGISACSFEHFTVQRCLGMIELTGNRQGRRESQLLIGFSDVEPTSMPRMQVSEERATDYMVLPTERMASVINIASMLQAHFRIGPARGDNAVASDSTTL